MAKRENSTLLIKDLMNLFIKENNLKKGIQKLQIQEVWIKLMGKGITRYTSSVQLQNQTLVVELTSSVLREELHYGKEKIIKMLNEELKQELIKKIVFL